MEIGFLGPLEVRSAGRLVDLRGARLRALLVRLALEPGRVLTVPTLADSLWAGDRLSDEVNALQSLVSRLRRALPEPGVLQSLPAGYRLAVEPAVIDAEVFLGLARAGREQIRRGDAEAAVRTLEKSLALWRGPALADVAAPFAPFEQSRLEEARLAAREALTEARLALGQAEDVIAELETLAMAHPLRERLRKLQLTALSMAGRQAEALAVYEDIRRTFAERLGVDPGAELQALHLDLLRGGGPRPAPTRPTSHGTAPRALTTFVGRDDDLAELATRIESNRLVTLVGPGGAGKTRLAAETAASLTARFPGGVWMAALAPLDEPRDLAHAVAGVLGLRERAFGAASSAPIPPPREAMDRLTDAFSGAAEALLVLDNCEHLIEAAADLAEQLLLHCPHLRVLATSREPLGIDGEVLAPVRPLGIPDEGSAPGQALRAASVRLFADRAAAVSPGFVVDGSNVGAVVEICRRLDGLPLALELAAARLRTLGVGQIAARLDDRFRLLTGGSRTALPRHRTLRAVVSWSWDLLDDGERELADRLAVYSGGVTPDSAAAASGRGSADVLEQLGALVDKSLLQVQDPDEPRYRMLETIREFGIERLAERGELAAARRAHAHYFLDLAEEADRYVRGAEQLPWIRLLGAERDNFSAALRYVVDIEDASTAVRLVAGLSSYWTLIGTHDEALEWARAALEVPGDSPPVARAIAVSVSVLSAAVGDVNPSEDAVATVEAAIEVAGGVDAHPLFSLMRTVLAFVRRDEEAAAAMIADGATARDPWARATLALISSMLHQNKGDQAGMRNQLKLAREQFEVLGDRWGLAMTAIVVAEMQTFDDEVAAAVEGFAEAAKHMAELGAHEDVALAYLRLSAVQGGSGRHDEARRSIDQLVQAARASRWPRLFPYVAFAEGLLACETGDLDAAREWFERCLDQPESGSSASPHLRSIALSALGSLDARNGDLARARERLCEAYRLGIQVQDMPIAATAVTGFAMQALAGGDAAAGARTLGLATALRGVEDRGPGLTRQVTGAVRAELDDETFARSYTAGVDVGRDAAMEELAALAAAEPVSEQRPAPAAGVTA